MRYKPRLTLFLCLTDQEVSVDLDGLSLLMPECPKAARVHHDRATNPKMRPEQASGPAVNLAALHYCRHLDLLRETGKLFVEHRVLKDERNECRDCGRHMMAESPSEAVPIPIAP